MGRKPIKKVEKPKKSPWMTKKKNFLDARTGMANLKVLGSRPEGVEFELTHMIENGTRKRSKDTRNIVVPTKDLDALREAIEMAKSEPIPSG